ncbi:hypothetical protein PR202_ga04121 [Eleusine coracana subsp. coracana]|uniref:Uncharacterized protein n=1 Tax=Eleusine coracana subsp. coracana TaxID=191504 RepID=A0AAV5BP34_ELECO|nr:hypothetical protein PR202_ga04121 [Eleusine coracana subsp. coracana]
MRLQPQYGERRRSVDVGLAATATALRRHKCRGGRKDAHLLPVELPEISSLIVSRGIEKMSWDVSGECLAISFKDGNEMYRGLVAVYDVRRSPLISLSLVSVSTAD